MKSYFAAARPRRALAEYPLGAEFLAGPARLSRDALHALQERRFLALVERAWEVPFYRRRWTAAGLAPGDVRSLEDRHHIPPYSKADLMASVEREPPLGDFHGRRPGEPMVLHTTSGTTGRPQPLPFGAWDREVQNLLLARAYRLQGLRDDDVAHSVYGFGLVNGGHYIREAVVHFTGALLLPAGTGLETPSARQVALMRDFRVTVLLGFADYLRRLAEVAREQGLEPGRDIPVRMVSGHLGAERPETLAGLWGGAEVFDWYGVGDTGVVAAEGPAHAGLHLFEDAHLVELIDPETGREVTEGPGSLCVSSLFRTGIYPIVRFNTHDVTELLAPDAGSGINMRRMVGVLGRSDQMVKLRGINVFPGAVGALLAGWPQLTGEYVCRVRRREGREGMTVVVELASGDDPPPAGLRVRLEAALREGLGVGVEVELVGPGETAPLTGLEERQKPVRLLDER